MSAARALLDARDHLLRAERDLMEARNDYVAAETAYLASFPQGEYPPNLLIGKTLVMANEEWYDLKPGARLSFHTVQVVAP